ncbi:hypothetical protein CY0110_18922 [Crocosphaera chwakensis CCY0110]|uniref:Uncharacterized protein n=1 Tax=Crocosphaera chwakensis CCY0110 TaxID=391612 RepID=A3IJB6_9CHRO|nr:hypothetical protein CY0110_18922 [Crocosphaera chwakensis CCY0110]
MQVEMTLGKILPMVMKISKITKN